MWGGVWTGVDGQSNIIGGSAQVYLLDKVFTFRDAGDS
jgi:hypothetical protein